MILIQCTKSKRADECAAKNLYDKSPLFRKMREYAELHTEDWRILSAKYGLVRPEQTVSPYDAYGIDEKYASIIVDEIEMHTDAVTILGGREYVEPLRDELAERRITLQDPLEGMKIGERMHWLDNKIRQAENKDITDVA